MHMLIFEHQACNNYFPITIIGCRGLLIELSKNKIPNLEKVRVIHVDQFWHLAVPDSVEVDLRTRTTRTKLSHLPEIVLHPEREHPITGNAAGERGEREGERERS